ncbi:MAG: DUF2905 domain-containing protein [Candidatus Omnitrophica bacterium]|nr:DUF2905 domain-containing protein [Candidatus Omnitrophota bacterium]
MIDNIGKFIVILGLIITFIGGIILLFSYLKLPLGRLPGDIVIQRKNFFFYFPLTTSIIISIFFSVLLYFIFRK